MHKKINTAWIVVIACSLNVAIFATSQAGINIALPSIQKNLNFDNEIQQWVINSFTLGSACTFIIFGKLGKIITSRCLYILGLITMFVASLGCAFSYSDISLLIFRFLQGISIAMSTPAAITIIRDSITDGKYDKYFSCFITLNTCYFIVGPTIFGYIIEYLSWRWIFLLVSPICILALIAILLTTNPKPLKPAKFDLLGSFLLGGGTFILILSFMNIGFNGFTKINQLLLVAFIVLSFSFILHARKKTNTILPLSFFKNIHVTICSGIGFTMQGSLMVMVFISLLLLEYFKLSPVQTGYFLMFTTAFGLISPTIFSVFTTDQNRKKIILMALTMLTISFFGLGISALNNSLLFCFLFTALFTFSMGPLLSSLPSQISASIDQEDIQEVNSIVFHFRYLGASLCTAIMGVLAYGNSANSEDSITNVEFLHVTLFISLLTIITILFIGKFMPKSPSKNLTL